MNFLPDRPALPTGGKTIPVLLQVLIWSRAEPGWASPKTVDLLPLLISVMAETGKQACNREAS